jgi:hypothetical protein
VNQGFDLDPIDSWILAHNDYNYVYTEPPSRINVTVKILSLSSFNDVTMEFTAQMRFQQEWYDDRLIVHDTVIKVSLHTG